MEKSQSNFFARPKESVEIGQRLLELREFECLTQEEMAKRLCLSVRAYRNYESGHRALPAKIVLKICIQFSLDAFWLYEGIGLGLDLRHKGGSPALWDEAIKVVDRFERDSGCAFSPEMKREIVVQVVQTVIDGGVTQEDFAPTSSE